MKSSLLLFFCLLSFTVFAHDARYHNSKIKTWSIVAENKTVEGGVVPFEPLKFNPVPSEFKELDKVRYTVRVGSDV